MKLIQKTTIITASLLILVSVIGYALTHYLTDPNKNTPLVYSKNAMLYELWTDYKKNTIEPGSKRTYDKSQSNITTSEGQSYTMLRAVWMDDKTTFDESWQFTKNNLQRPEDKLFSWKYGLKADGSYGILADIGGQNTASDADADIALALLMAYSRWNESSYGYEAKEIIKSIWDNEVVLIQGKPIFVANNLEKDNPESAIVNPSYFAPYSFRLFAKADPTHNWNGLVDSSYELLDKLSSDSLGSSKSVGLPPNWITIDKRSGDLKPNAAPNLNTDYGYDAIRTPWRVALDYMWNKDKRAYALLEKFSYLDEHYSTDNKLAAVYKHDGTIVDSYETPAMYGTAIGYFKTVKPGQADTLYRQKLLPLYDPDKQGLTEPLSYYDDNWAWFGIAMYNDALPNIAQENY